MPFYCWLRSLCCQTFIVMDSFLFYINGKCQLEMCLLRHLLLPNTSQFNFIWVIKNDSHSNGVYSWINTLSFNKVFLMQLCLFRSIGAQESGKRKEKAIYFTFIYCNFYESFYFLFQTPSQWGGLPQRKQEWSKCLTKGDQPIYRQFNKTIKKFRLMVFLLHFCNVFL